MKFSIRSRYYGSRRFTEIWSRTEIETRLFITGLLLSDIVKSEYVFSKLMVSGLLILRSLWSIFLIIFQFISHGE